VEFELDARNLKHFREDHPERGITRELLNDVVARRPRLQSNDPTESRSATHKVVGPDLTGRFWTFPAVHVIGDKWRPITGWPSTRVEIAMYNEEADA
jgi:hypothetical protein